MQYKTICIDLVHNVLIFTLEKKTMRKRFTNLSNFVQKVATESSKSLPVQPLALHVNYTYEEFT